MQVYYDSARTYETVRLHPYTANAPGQTGYVDLKANPEQIASAMEDFIPYSHTEAIQRFYRLLQEINGPQSHLETSDCAFRPPRSHHDPNSHLALSAYGRLYILFRDVRLNCLPAQAEWLCGKLMALLSESDPALTAAEAVIGFTQVKILHTALSKGTWKDEQQFECSDGDPGHGTHLMLSFWAYGNTEKEVYENLARVFHNITLSCREVSSKIDAAQKK